MDHAGDSRNQIVTRGCFWTFVKHLDQNQSIDFKVETLYNLMKQTPKFLPCARLRGGNQDDGLSQLPDGVRHRARAVVQGRPSGARTAAPCPHSPGLCPPFPAPRTKFHRPDRPMRRSAPSKECRPADAGAEQERAPQAGRRGIDSNE
jgi:hypothetical protein